MCEPVDRPCDCGAVLRCAAAGAGTPVYYEEVFNEFRLEVARVSWRLVYCFNCGGRLPESVRGRRFSAPSAEDCAAVAAILPRLRSVGDVLCELGPADPVDFWDARLQWPPRERSWRRQLVYARRWRSMVLVVMEYADGSVSFGLNGKPVESQNSNLS
jgi:hypothetical protein